MNIYPTPDVNTPHIEENNKGDGMYVKAQQTFLEVKRQKIKKIDNTKLLFPIHVDPQQYNTHEELYKAIIEWWTNGKHRAQKTIEKRIQTARTMQRDLFLPINWFNFFENPEQIINHLMNKINVEYKEKQRLTGNYTYGMHEIRNKWKTIKTFAEAYGVDINWWGWTPPPIPENQVKHVPRPKIVNKLIHHRYSKDKYINALIKTILTFGFYTGVRPEEIITLQVHNIDFENGYIIITEQKKRYRNRQIWLDKPVIYSHQQNSLRNWIDIWRPQATKKQDGFLFIKKDGSPFNTEDALRRYLSKYCKPIWPYFCPKIMRDWHAIAYLIKTKETTKKWDIRQVTKRLGHKYESTTEGYIEFAEQYYNNDQYDWLRAVLKFHPNSLRMQSLMKQDYWPSQEIPEKLTNAKKGSPEVKVSSVGDYGPTGIRTPVTGSEGRKDIQTTS